MKKIFFLFTISLLLFSCARVGAPNGGKKDSLAPKFLGSNIDTTRVNISTHLKELRLNFDEYVMLKDVNKNLVISPEIKKIKKIIPSNLANKYILIQWEDSLQANTTYNFNFGNAIADNNEGNILPYFNFAFSTGAQLDQLFISGTVTDGMVFQKKSISPKENKMVVGLYNATENTDFKKKPNYITKVDEENYFEINYLKKGDYYILAFEDENQNSVYDPGKEKVGFLKEKISLDSTSIRGLKLKIYPSKKVVKYKDYKSVNGGLLLTFEGNPENVEVKSISEELQDYKVTHQPKSDSVNVWFSPENNKIQKNFSTPLKLSYAADQKSDTVSVNYKAVKKELTLTNKEGNLLVPENPFRIVSTLPIENLKSEKWKLEADSIEQNFSAKISENNPFEIAVEATFKPGKKYALTLPKESVNSYYAKSEKSYRFEFEVDKPENYGNFKITLQNKPIAKFWLELLDEKGEVKYHKFGNDTEITFTNLKPGLYSARIKVDNNGSGYWDEADFAQKILAEDVFIFGKEIEVRPLWTIEENWEIK
jgi:uncharacterized protein (DUF2141 family)